MCSSLQAQGIEILIATTDADGDKRLPAPLGEKTTFEGIPTIFFTRQWSEALKYSRPLAKWLEHNVINFDLVHIHAVFSHACVSAARACGKHRVPYLVRPLGALDPWSIKQKSGRKRIFWHLGVKQMLAGAAHIHYTTDDEKLLAEKGLSLARGIVVPEGIDLSFTERQTEPFGAGRPQIGHNPYILALSRIHPKKGFEMLIESFAALKKSGSFSDWRLVFAGDGEAGYVDQLKTLASLRGLNGDAVFAGWIDGDQKYAALKDASLLAMPSYQENFGLSLVEAMACGVPVLVSPHVNLAPDIEKAEAGWVAALREDAMANALAEALGNEQERRRRGNNGRELAGGYGSAKVATRLIDLYRSLCK
jgi:glycosyltransferase involved in cell wall biosynthesis